MNRWKAEKHKKPGRSGQAKFFIYVSGLEQLAEPRGVRVGGRSGGLGKAGGLGKRAGLEKLVGQESLADLESGAPGKK